MRKKSSLLPLFLALLLSVPVLALPRAAQVSRTLIVNGQAAQVNVVQINGRSYADLEALAQAANGLLAIQGNQIMLTLPGASNAPAISPSPTSGPTAAAAPPSNPPPTPGLSKGFRTAAIEAMSVVREWHSALANCIRNGFPISGGWLAGYRSQAVEALRLTSVAESTDADRNAFQLLTNGFNFMDQLSNQYMATRQSLNYISPDALKNDPLDQKLVNCGHSIGSMVASGQFVDDGSCQ
jgi:hypothetical protein